MKLKLTLKNPLWHLLINNFPLTICFLHFKHDPVTAFIAYVHMKELFRNTRDLSEIKFPDPSTHFYVPGELYIFFELNLHSYPLNEYT